MSSGGARPVRARAGRALSVLVPANQRRTLPEIVDRLDLDTGDLGAKRSAFWVMLVLSGIIAVSGVVTDSTATVIGAMIIAPLATPILGIGLGIVLGERAPAARSLLYVVSGVAVVVLLGLLATLVLPSVSGVVTNSQITGRTSPGVGDLVAAFATGFAGAIALARRDLGDVLPGIAIAISLVPPLGVVGVCLGEGEPSLAAGALLLFVSNAVALVIAAVVVFSGVGYAREERSRGGDPAGGRRRRSRPVVALAVVLLVAAPMVLNSVQAGLADLWLSQVRAAALDWAGTGENATVDDVRWHGHDVVVEVRSPGAVPDVGTLQDRVDELVPWEPDVILVHTVGERVDPARG
ncbi:TIGR00341 family protein [Oerskovia flava]|uniref:TIGR00341 family protein n=1 Tax=Oerskovia flava TaxID=2986422 RepID=UPI00223EDE7F|nr:TIGR00341 family protein [Oerskovia sp. JB1-3-2]